MSKEYFKLQNIHKILTIDDFKYDSSDEIILSESLSSSDYILPPIDNNATDDIFDKYIENISQLTYNRKKQEFIEKNHKYVLKNENIPEYSLLFMDPNFDLKNKEYFNQTVGFQSIHEIPIILKQLHQCIDFIESGLEKLVKNRSKDIFDAITIQKETLTSLNSVSKCVSSLKISIDNQITKFTLPVVEIIILLRNYLYDIRILKNLNDINFVHSNYETSVTFINNQKFIEAFTLIHQSLAQSLEPNDVVIKIIENFTKLKHHLSKLCLLNISSLFTKYFTKYISFKNFNESILTEQMNLLYDCIFIAGYSDIDMILKIILKKALLVTDHFINELLLQKIQERESDEFIDAGNHNKSDWLSLFFEVYERCRNLLSGFQNFIKITRQIFDDLKIRHFSESYTGSLDFIQHERFLFTFETFDFLQFIETITSFSHGVIKRYSSVVLSSEKNSNNELSVKEAVDAFKLENNLIQYADETFHFSLDYKPLLYGQAKLHLSNWHFEILQNLVSVFDNESFHRVDIPVEFQAIVDEIIHCSGNSSLSFKKSQTSDLSTNKKHNLLLDGREYILLNSAIFAINLLYKQLEYLEQSPLFSEQILLDLVEIYRIVDKKFQNFCANFNDSNANIDETTICNRISLIIRSLECLSSLQPFFINYFKIRRFDIDVNNYDKFNSIDYDIKQHIKSLLDFIISKSIDGMFFNSNKWLMNITNSPSRFILQLCRKLEKLHDCLLPVMIIHNRSHIFDNIHKESQSKLSNIIEQHAKKSNCDLKELNDFALKELNYLAERFKSLQYSKTLDSISSDFLRNLNILD